MEMILQDYTAPKPLRGTPHPIPEGIEGVKKLLEVARNEKQTALVALCGYCGLRVSEALKVKPSHFDLHRDDISCLRQGRQAARRACV
jgi:integrase